MSPASPEPERFKPPECPYKQLLFEALKDAIGSVLSLNGRLMEAVIEGNVDRIESTSTLLHAAHDRKCSLITAYTLHLREHGC